MAKPVKEPKTATASPEMIVNAIKEGRSLIEQGKSKADASMAIFKLIGDQPQEVVVHAFVEGATLTPKGALTYWYNCRRKLVKERKTSE